MKINKTLILTVCMSLMISQAFAWGQIGHYLIGYMASMQMKNSTRKKVESIIFPMSIGRSGIWMDEIKSDRAYDYVNSWHYLTSKNGEYDPKLQEKGGNAYEAITRLKAELKTGNLSPKEEAEKLKMLIHLVEDIHQPLHVGTGEDRGGNDIKLEYFRQQSNLHSVWDSGMIDGWDMSYTEIGNELSRRITSEMVDKYRNSTIDDWLKEAVSARPMVYKLPENMKLSYNYGFDNRELLEERLIAASVRLAQILQEIYG